MEIPEMFRSAEHHKRGFVNGLRTVAQSDEINAAILLAASYSQSPGLFDQELRAAQGEALRRICEKYKAQLGSLVKSEREDIAVLRGIRDLARNGLPPTRTRVIDGIWVAQFNPVRGLRPSRGASRPVVSIYEHEPWETLKLHFDMDRVQSERIWEGKLGEGELGDRFTSLFLNMFPFADCHGVLVPDRGKHYRQELSKDLHAWAWSVVRLVGARIPSFGMGYNSLGAYASVDHLHWQTFIDPAGLPVTDARWLHNGGDLPYPLPCTKFVDERGSWGWIQDRHNADRPYNLIYTPAGVFCFARGFQGSYTHAGWTSGFAWYECGGGMIAFRGPDYDALTPAMILCEYANMSIA
jgi:diadenosine tetraphosphate (Ap4A) HIT family hydrolase